MKIVIVTQNAPIYIPEFLDLFLSKLNKKIKVNRIIILSFPKGLLKTIGNYFGLYGIKRFIIFCLRILRRKLSGSRTVTGIARANGIKICRVKKIKAEDFVNFAKDNKIDLLVSIASPQIFSKKIFAAAKLGAINYHSSLLPKYRGRMPLFWTLYNGKKYCGITVHRIAKKLDAGAILAQKKIKILPTDSLDDLYKKTTKVGAPVLAETINNFSKIKGVSMNGGDRKTYGFPNKKESTIFRKKQRFF